MLPISIPQGYHFPPRAGTLFVAASNALDVSKAQADYVCDGTNDQEEIQEAINRIALSSHGKGLVRLSEGKFYISAKVSLLSGVSVIGLEGLWTTEIIVDAGVTAFEFQALAANRGMFDIKNMTINGGATAISLIVDDVLGGYVPMDITLERVFGFQQTSHAFILGLFEGGVGTAAIWGLRLRNCLAELTGGHGFYICGAECYVYGCFVSVVDGTGFYIVSSSDVKLSGNYARNTGKHGFFIDNSRGEVLYNTAYNFNTSDGIAAAGAGFSLNGLDRGSFVGNTIENGPDATDMKNYGVLLANNPSGLAMSANHFKGSDGHRLYYGIYGSGDDIAKGADIRGNVFNKYIKYPFTNAVRNSANMWSGHSDVFTNILAASASHIRNNEDLSAALPIEFTIDAQPDVPRKAYVDLGAPGNITAFTIVVEGIDGKGNSVSETKTEADGWAFYTDNAYATISVSMTERTGTGVGDTADVGISDVVGLSNKIHKADDVYKINKNAAHVAVGGAQIDLDYDTYDLGAVIGVVGGDDFAIWFRTTQNTIME